MWIEYFFGFNFLRLNVHFGHRFS